MPVSDPASKSTPPGSRSRWRLLLQLERWLEPAMILLGLIWLALIIVEFAWGTTHSSERINTAIWIIFIADFLFRFTLAPRKAPYLRRNWITLIALALPALRVLRIARVLRLMRATRGLRLVRLLTSMNRGFRSLGRTMQRRGAIYIGALTILVILAGAAGMLAFEGRNSNRGFDDYADALWWTAMLVTTVGSDYWPQTLEGRILSLLLSVYAVGVFGYLAATLASFFIGGDVQSRQEASVEKLLQGFRTEIGQLREEIGLLRRTQVAAIGPATGKTTDSHDDER